MVYHSSVPSRLTDVVKVRMQLQQAGPTATGLVRCLQDDAIPARRNVTQLGTARSMYIAEGVTSFTKGLVPAVSRAMIYGGLRLGLYAPIRDAIHSSPGAYHSSLTTKLAAGALSGAIAAAVTNPLDLVKTRLQGQGRVSNPLTLVRELVATSGVAGLWKGTAAGATRAAVLTASQCVTYDAAKRVRRV